MQGEGEFNNKFSFDCSSKCWILNNLKGLFIIAGFSNFSIKKYLFNKQFIKINRCVQNHLVHMNTLFQPSKLNIHCYYDFNYSTTHNYHFPQFFNYFLIITTVYSTGFLFNTQHKYKYNLKSRFKD